MAGLAAAASEPLSGHSALGGSRGALGAWQEAAGAPLPWQRPAALWAKGRGGEERSPEWEGAERGVGPLPPAGYATTGRHSCSLRLRRRIRDGRTRVPCAQARCKQNGAGQGRPLPLAHRGARSRRRGAAQRGRGARRQARLGRWLGRPQRRDRRRTHAPHGGLPPCTMTGRMDPCPPPCHAPSPGGGVGWGSVSVGASPKQETGGGQVPAAQAWGL